MTSAPWSLGWVSTAPEPVLPEIDDPQPSACAPGVRSSETQIVASPPPPADGPRPVRLRLSRKAGFSLQALSEATNGLPAVNVTRRGKWGNPHIPLRTWYHCGYPALGIPAFDAVTTADADAEGVRIAVALHRHEVLQRLAHDPVQGPTFRADLEHLRGKNLACWCHLDAPCHADIYLDVANRPVCEAAP